MKRCVTELKPGMILASDVTAGDDRLLLPAGTELDDHGLRVLNIWGVSEADVRPESFDREDGPTPEHRAAAVALADAVFAHVDLSAPPMASLKRACVDDYAGRLAAGESAPPPPGPWTGGPLRSDAPRHADAAEFLAGDVAPGVFPAVYHRIVEALRNPFSTSASLAGIIADDPGLSARLLALVNSALYGYGGPVDSLSRAVSLVGTRGLCRLALAVTVLGGFRGVVGEHFDMAELRRHAVARAVLCRLLASRVDGASQDLCFLAGLVRGVGRLVMLQREPEAMETARALSLARSISLEAAEERVFGFHSRRAAATLFSLWRFPENVIAAACGDAARPDPPVEAAVCAVGSLLATAMRCGSDGDGFVRDLPAGVWDALGLPEGASAATMVTARRQIDDLLNIFREEP